MGNQNCSIGLQLDQSKCQAGETVSGRIYVLVGSDFASTVRVRTGSIDIQLEGFERAEVYRRIDYSRERMVHTITRIGYPQVRYSSSLQAGQYEYPFVCTLPDNIPGTLLRCSNKTGQNFVEIQYTLTAHLVLKGRMANAPGKSPRELQRKTAKILHIKAKPPAIVRRRLDVCIHPYPIQTCYFLKRGCIHFACGVEKSAVCPGETVVVRCCGENLSTLKLNYVVVKLVEYISWKTSYRELCTHCESTQRILSKSKVTLSGTPSRSNSASAPSSSESHMDFEAAIKIPLDARDSYRGKLVRISHNMVVTLVLEGGILTTSPRSTFDVAVVRRPARSPHSFVESKRTSTDYPIAVARLALPEDSHPVAADIVASEMLLDAM